MMKVIYKITIILFFTNVLTCQDWKYLSDRIGGVMTVACPDSNNCYCLVQENLGFDDTGPLLFKSTDQGATWDSIYKSYPEKWPNITLFNGRAGASPDPYNYFIAWWDVPAISKSTDGGHTFSKIFLDTIDLYNRNLYEFTMYDSNYGYARADGGLYFTNDGWESFENRIYWDSVWLDPEVPLFLDSNILATVTYLDKPGNRGYRFTKYFINKDKFDISYNFGYEPITGHFIYIVKLYFLNDTVGYACGYAPSGIGETRNGLLFRTKDGGQNWTIVFKDSTIPNFGFNDIAFYDDKRGVVVGYYGKIFFTKDGGDTWVRSISEVFDKEKPPLNYVTWAGRYPLIGTSTIGIYRYEGDFFKFPPEDTTGVGELLITNYELRITPNPASEFVEIIGDSRQQTSFDKLRMTDGRQNENIRIYNIFGQCVLSVGAGSEPAHTLRIDISHLPVGLYFVRIDNKILKFIKM